MNDIYHIPVLKDEAIAGLVKNPSGVYVDLTFGGGGHAKMILSKLADNGKLIAFDQDMDAFEKNPLADERCTFIHHNFVHVKRYLTFLGIDTVDGVLADLGVSSHHFDSSDRGFSYRSDALLDMRMNKAMKTNARDILNTYSDRELYRMFRYYGEVKNPGKVVSAIIQYRKEKDVKKISDFIEAIKDCIPKNRENKYLSQIFQAVRIEVNRELDVLKDMLMKTSSILSQGGRLVVISYHSLEDKLVKNFIKTGNLEGEEEKDFHGNRIAPFKSVGKLIMPEEEEIRENVRARSARLRIAEKL